MVILELQVSVKDTTAQSDTIFGSIAPFQHPPLRLGGVLTIVGRAVGGISVVHEDVKHQRGET